MTALAPDPYATGVLKEDVHDMLVKNLSNYSREAGIHPRWVWTPLSQTCSSDVVDYVKMFNIYRSEGVRHGIMFTRAFDGQGKPDEQLAAIAGALMRNFIKPRFMTLHSVLEALDGGDPINETCLLIPNFCLSKAEAGGKGDALPGFKIQKLYDLLVKRGNLGLQTMLYVTSLDHLSEEYGSAMRDFLHSHLTVVAI